MAGQRLTQADVARVLHVSRSGVSDRLGGSKDFDIKELPALAELLGVSIAYLLGLTNDRSPGRVAGASGEVYTPSDSNREPADSCTATLIRFPLERIWAAA